MAKQALDTVTAELPGLPEIKRRGRPPKNGIAAMTPAQKQHDYRRRRQIADLPDSWGRDELRCVVSAKAQSALVNICKQTGETRAQVLERLLWAEFVSLPWQ